MNFIKNLLNLQQTPIETTLTVTSANGFHLRPIAQFVNEAKAFKSTITLKAKGEEASAKQVPSILSLTLEQGDSFVLSCRGEDSEEASLFLTAYFEQLMNSDKLVEAAIQESETYETESLRGETIAKGIAIAALVSYDLSEVSSNNSKNISIRDAIKRVKDELYELYIRNKENDEALIFLAQQELIASDIFRYECPDLKAFRQIVRQQIAKLKNTKFEARISDYLDVEQRVLKHLGISSTFEVPLDPFILVAEDLLPSDIMMLKDTSIEGVILEKGTISSHASILLRSYGIPSMIVPIPIEALYQNAVLDANSGDLLLEPSNKDVQKAINKQKSFQEKELKSYQERFEPATTKDNTNIKILANITNLESAQEAKEDGADGVGLLRTEFLFTEVKPTIEEQTKAYSEIFDIFPEITIRTLDIGGDKSLPYIDIPHEDNPFLGLRGIRFSLQEQTLFKEQLLAIFLAHKGRNIKIMFPMVSDKAEFLEAKAIAHEVANEKNINISHIQFGMMIEVPAVIFALKIFDKEVDFYSIGTNDLTQYLFAIERTHPTLQVDPLSPIVMSALKIIIDSTHKPVSICGELAGMEEATEQLIHMGYTTLSVSSKLIPSIKERIRNV